jgi:hypothetical protein
MKNEVVGFGQGLNEVWVVVQESEGWLLSVFQNEKEAVKAANQLNQRHKFRTAVAKFKIDAATIKGFASLEEEEEEE